MILELLKRYLPIILILAFFGYRYYKKRKIRKMLPELKNRGAQIVDVRSAQEFYSANNPASINIPLNEIDTQLRKLKKDLPIILCCASGARSGMAARLMRSKGFEAHNAGNWQNTL